MKKNNIYQGHCIDELKKIENEVVDLVYLDPPFFTQKEHSLKPRNKSKEYKFNDKWDSLESYLSVISDCLKQCKRTLKKTGSIFLHCDKSASHHLRIVLDNVFGADNFQSEIIWYYKRWSNSKNGLLPSHQNIFFYSKTDKYKFNTIYTDYSPTTNIDQILQERIRKANGKSAYKKDENGNVVLGKEKKGVPLSDVWEIPYLNPKAKERVGYPTQKPVILINRILEIATQKNDLIVDPFCGSGTTCVSAKNLNRNYIGIDISEEAVRLANNRLEEMVITKSKLVQKGKSNYLEKSEYELSILASIRAIPVQRNTGIDGILKEHFDNKPVPIKIQSENESIYESINKLVKATETKDFNKMIVIQTRVNNSLFNNIEVPDKIEIVKSTDLQVLNTLSINKD